MRCILAFYIDYMENSLLIAKPAPFMVAAPGTEMGAVSYFFTKKKGEEKSPFKAKAPTFLRMSGVSGASRVFALSEDTCAYA